MDKPVYRMSEAGKCPRALSADKLGYEPTPAPAWLEQAAEEGRWHEDRMKEQLRQEGYKVKECLGCPVCLKRYGESREGIHVELDFPTFTLVGHLDAKLQKNKQVKGAEFKSMSQYEFDRWIKNRFEAFPDYASQISCYMEADQHDEWLYWVKNRSSGYIDKQILTAPPTPVASVESTLTEVTNFVVEGLLHPAEFNSQSIECRRCLYQHLCITEPELTKVDAHRLDQAVLQWRNGDLLVTEGEKMVEDARTILEAWARQIPQKKYVYNELEVVLVQYTEQKTYPKANLLKVFTEEQLEPAVKVREAYEQLRVKDLREKNNG